MLIGVLADTHIPQRLEAIPQAVFDIFQSVDLILHAGDMVNPRILEGLAQIAPVKAVRGNIHLVDRTIDDTQLPIVERFDLLGHKVILVHGHGSFLRGSLERVRYWISQDRDEVNRRIVLFHLRAYPGANLIVFAHSHRSYNRKMGDALLFNPGAVCYTEGETPSVGLLTIERDRIEGRIINLE